MVFAEMPNKRWQVVVGCIAEQAPRPCTIKLIVSTKSMSCIRYKRDLLDFIGIALIFWQQVTCGLLDFFDRWEDVDLLFNVLTVLKMYVIVLTARYNLMSRRMRNHRWSLLNYWQLSTWSARSWVNILRKLSEMREIVVMRLLQ